MSIIVKREVVIKPDSFKVGDRIEFNLLTGETVSAVAIKRVKDGMLFVFEECLGHSSRTEIYNYMNENLYNRMPNDIKDRMVGRLSLLTKAEVFGTETKEPIPYFKKSRNRTTGNAFSSKQEWNDGWWLENQYSATAFAHVYADGAAYYDYASAVVGCRPVFTLKNL